MVGKEGLVERCYPMARLAASSREMTRAEYRVPAPRGQRRRRESPLVTEWKSGHATQSLQSLGTVPLGTIANLLWCR